ncbi:hypothetical protein AVEN_127420-1, partial [Araneus ventricosus]
MSECKSCSTPLEPKCTQADFTNSELFKGPFRELIGPLLFQAVTTRRDILFTVNCFSQLQEKPTAAAWTQKDLQIVCVRFRTMFCNCPILCCTKQNCISLSSTETEIIALRKLGLPTSDSFCENCILAKQSAEPIGKENRRRESAPMRIIHSDLCGPVESATLS